MKNIIGQPARGDNFYPRKREVNKIIDSLSNCNNIQITAPRRVGKTSILWFLFDNDYANRRYVYVDTESIANEQEFFKKLLQEILRNEHISGSLKLKTAFEGANKFLKKLKSIKILNVGIELSQEMATHDYFEELENFLAGYALEESIELVILIDEFPQTIENIKLANEPEAVTFLQKNRTLRLNPEINGKVKFIYTGSIGLNQTVSRLNATATINDINSIEVGPLSDDEARDLFRELLKPYDLISSVAAEDTLLHIIQWYIPFHIQLIVQEIVQQATAGKDVSAAIVEHSVDSIVSLKNQNHFDHYYTRLKVQFKDDSFKYADELLKDIATKDTVDKTYVFDLAAKYGLNNDYRKIIETLMYDGYINYIEDTKEYRFNSPIVKRWWLKFIC